MDRTIRAAGVNKRTVAYNAGLASGNMSEYKTSCSALRRAVRATKHRNREHIVTFPAKWLPKYVARTKNYLCLWKQILCSCECRTIAGWQVKLFLGPFWMQPLQRESANLRVRERQSERWCGHCVWGRGSEGPKARECQESSRSRWDSWPCSKDLCWFVYI